MILNVGTLKVIEIMLWLIKLQLLVHKLVLVKHEQNCASNCFEKCYPFLEVT